MTDPYRGQPQGEPYPYGVPGYSDPAYGNQVPYSQPYQQPYGPNPTQQLPPYDPYGTGTYHQPFPPDEPPPNPPSRKWLWVLATVSLLTVLGLIIAVVIIDSSSQQTVVAPPPTMQPAEPSAPTTTTRTPTTTPRPTAPAPRTTATVPSTPVVPPVPSGPAQTVVYDVTGTGRAISITYVDADGILQTEFNVMLPWSKSVELSDPNSMASVNIINFGREISCSITVGGAQVESNTGAGLTICGALR
jgi:hypothetical protein